MRGPIERAPPATGLHLHRQRNARDFSRAEAAETGTYFPYGEEEAGRRREEGGIREARRGLPPLNDGGGRHRTSIARNRGGETLRGRFSLDAVSGGGEEKP